MAEDKMVTVFETNDVGQAEIIRAALEAEGIDCALENEHQAGFTGALKCELMVMAANEARAREFIAQHERKHHRH